MIFMLWPSYCRYRSRCCVRLFTYSFKGVHIDCVNGSNMGTDNEQSGTIDKTQWQQASGPDIQPSWGVRAHSARCTLSACNGEEWMLSMRWVHCLSEVEVVVVLVASNRASISWIVRSSCGVLEQHNHGDGGLYWKRNAMMKRSRVNCIDDHGSREAEQIEIDAGSELADLSTLCLSRAVG